jgi:hypothetical protein
MPSPEQLGLGAGETPAGPGRLDWNAALEQVRHLGATGFNLTRLPEGGCRVSLLLPADQPGRSQYVEATAATEAEAARLALQRAAECSARP